MERLKKYNLAMWYRRWIKNQIKLYKPSILNPSQKREIKKFYAPYGYKNVNTDWHRFLVSSTKQFSVKYVPEDILHSIITMAFNNMKQWPALLDKNLSRVMFSKVKQPRTILKNINGLYYNNNNISLETAIECCLNNPKFVIQPSIESSGGKGVSLYNTGNKTENDILLLFQKYKKDFIAQEVVSQNLEMAK